MVAAIQRFFESLTVGQVVTTVVDVALVYYLVYRLLLTIRGTRAAQMIVGIVLIGAAFFVAVRIELTTVSWLLDNFISYFIILIIVVFQQDIRRALGRIGQNVMPIGRRLSSTMARYLRRSVWQSATMWRSATSGAVVGASPVSKGAMQGPTVAAGKDRATAKNDSLMKVL